MYWKIRMTLPGRNSRRTTIHLPPSHTQPRTERVGKPASARSLPERKILKLLARAKTAETEVVYLRAVANALVREINKLPEVAAELVPIAFVATCAELAANDEALSVAMSNVLAHIGPETARLMFADILTGPRLVVALGRDPARLRELAALPATEQAIALGRFIAELESAPRRPQPSAPPSSIFGLYQNLMSDGTP
jgi:hypothetical protein